jgi:branched-chain amino acid transport system ATP-binding protein
MNSGSNVTGDAASGETLLAVDGVSLRFGGVKAITDVSFDIRKGEIRAIIGPNGAGKTSMLNWSTASTIPSTAASPTRARRRPRMKSAPGREPRHRPYLPERGAVQAACRRSTTS